MLNLMAKGSSLLSCILRKKGWDVIGNIELILFGSICIQWRKSNFGKYVLSKCLLFQLGINYYQ